MNKPGDAEITHRAAVLGKPIDHSLSPLIHNAGYEALGLHNWHYSRFEVDGEGLADFLSQVDDSYVGFSVTMPGKFAAIECASQVSGRALAIGTANTLVRTDTGWFADNTDCDGVLGALGQLCPDELSNITDVVVLGAGGTARPVLWALGSLGVERVTVVNRSDRSSDWAGLAETMGLQWAVANWDDDVESLTMQADLVISTVPSAALKGKESAVAHAPVLDVIYEPWPTPLVIHAAANGHPAVGGHIMLAHQAFGQFSQFTGKPAPKEAMWEALRSALDLNDTVQD